MKPEFYLNIVDALVKDGYVVLTDAFDSDLALRFIG